MSREATMSDLPPANPQPAPDRAISRRVADPELVAISDIIARLDSLPSLSQRRVIEYVTDRVFAVEAVKVINIDA